MNITKMSGALLPLFLATLSPLHAAEPGRPNILVIYTDDHGWADIGAQGMNKDIRTPNIDQLARDGVRCFRGYVSAPQCTPSRAGVITGRYQEKFGLEQNGQGPLPLSEVSIAERLKAAGYVSGQVGKWHLAGEGDASEKLQMAHLPPDYGFNEYWCGPMRHYYASHDLKGNPLPDAPKLVIDTDFRVTVQTEAALGFLDRRTIQPRQPWFLYLAYFAPHVPLEAPEPWYSKTPKNLPIERREALAMIACMDDGVGRIRAKLRAMGEETNTLIFLISDNGAPLKPGSWDGSLNLPLIGEKGMLTDGGVRTPFVIAWPGTLPAGKVYDLPVFNLDVAATANALAGLPTDPKLDGVNLMPYLTGENQAEPHDYLYWRWRSQSSVLNFPWKLIHVGPKESYLFNVTTPDGEMTNLISLHPEIAGRLDAKLTAWLAGLKPPGPPRVDVTQDHTFFAVHVDRSESDALYASHVEKAEKPGKRALKQRGETEASGPSASIQGWQARGGLLSVKDGALVLTPSGPTAAFLTCTGLNIPGPVTVVMRVRATEGGPSSFAWRTKATADFVPENTAAFVWPTSADWQEVKTELPVVGSLFHIRINPGKDCAGLKIQSIELRGQNGKTQVWHFDSTQSSE